MSFMQLFSIPEWPKIQNKDTSYFYFIEFAFESW